MKRYLLDTNTVSHLIKGHPIAGKRVLAVPMASLCTSAITHGELLFGLALRPDAKRLHLAVQELLLRVDVLPWDSGAAGAYGLLRSELKQQGMTLAPLDMHIAAHALSLDAVMVTSDRAFFQIRDLQVEDWTA